MDDERLFGLLTLAPAHARDFPKTDYPALVDRIDAVLRANLFDPAAYEAPGTRTFLRWLRAAGRKARDDAEFLMAWMFASRHLTFSHCYVGRKLDPQFEDRLAEASSIPPRTPGKAKVISATGDEAIVTLRIASFEGDSYDGIDEAFEDIIGRNLRALITDTTADSGGNVTSDGGDPLPARLRCDNRGALTASVFGVLSLIAHDRWRRDNWNGGVVVGPMLLAASLLSKGNSSAACNGIHLAGVQRLFERSSVP